MNKKRTYVFGCGRYFIDKQSDILKKYDIVAILDNNKEGMVELINGCSVPVLKPVDCIKQNDIPIILMAYDVFSIWESLKKLSIDERRIIFPNKFEPLINDERIFHTDGGEFRIMDKNIYYVNKRGRHQVDSVEALGNLSRYLEKECIDASFITKQATVEPLNREFGLSRGTPIDRFYIESWLQRNREFIRGDVLEIAEDTYTKRFGGRDTVPHILHVSMEKEGIIKGNLETGEGIEEDTMDCIILTQTLPFIYGYENVISNLYKMLRKGGSALITTGGISQISRYDMERWGHFWSFTPAALKRLIEKSAFSKSYVMTAYGNVKTACALLYGIAAEELQKEELEFTDEDYPVSICAVLRK